MSLHSVLKSIVLSQEKCEGLRKPACAQGKDNVSTMSTDCVSGADIESG